MWKLHDIIRGFSWRIQVHKLEKGNITNCVLSPVLWQQYTTFLENFVKCKIPDGLNLFEFQSLVLWYCVHLLWHGTRASLLAESLKALVCSGDYIVKKLCNFCDLLQKLNIMYSTKQMERFDKYCWLVIFAMKNFCLTSLAALSWTVNNFGRILQQNLKVLILAQIRMTVTLKILVSTTLRSKSYTTCCHSVHLLCNQEHI